MIIKFMKALSMVLQMGPDKILKLQKESKTDSLTGLLNRRGFCERIEIEKRRSDRYGHRILIVYLDVDNLKEINDFQGHDKGDEAMVHLAEIIKRNCRFVDFAGRIGGDEFVVAFNETTKDNDCVIIERLKSELDNVSIGYHHYCGNDLPIDGAILVAETMMRKEKQRRKAKNREN